jgi:hypothetical protein
MANIGDLFFTLGLDDAKLIPDAKKQGQAAGVAAGQEASKSLGSKLGTGLKTSFMGMGVAASGAFALATKGALEMESVQVDLQRETGLTADEAKRAASEINGIAGRNVQDIGAVSAAFAKVHNDLGLTGDAANKATEAFVRFGRATGQQAASAVSAFDDILDSFGLTAADAAGIMDKLVVSHQKYGGSIEENQSALAHMAPQLKALNLGLDDGIGLLNLFAASGLDASSGQKALNAAIKKLPPGETLDQFLVRLSKVQDDGQRAQLAMSVFGTKAGAGLANAIKPGVSSLKDFEISAEDAAGATDKAADVIDSSFSGRIAKAASIAGAALRQFGADFGPAVTGVASLGTLVGSVFPGIGSKIVGGLAGAVKGIGRRFAAAIGIELGSKVVADTAAKAVGGALAEGVSQAAGDAAGATAAQGLGAKMAGFLTKTLGALKIAVPITIALVATFELVQTFEQVKGQIQAQTNAVAAQTAAFAETATLDALKKSREGVAAQLSNLSHDPIADALGISARKGLENTLATLDAEIVRRSGSAQASGEKLGNAYGAGLDASFDRAGEGSNALARATSASVAEAGKAAEPAAHKAGKHVGNVFKDATAGAVKAGKPAVKQSASELISSVTQGILDKQDEVDAALSAALDFQKSAKNRPQQAAHLIGVLTGQELIKGLHDKNPAVRQAFDLVRQDALDRLKTLGINMNHLGKAGGEELAKALKSKDPDVRAAAERLRATLEGNVKPTTAPAGFKAGGDLAAALASTDPVVRGAALKLKGAIEANTRANTAGSGGAAGTDLASALASKDPDVRNAALALKRTIENHTRANTAPKGAAATTDLATGLNSPAGRQAIINAASGLVRFINGLLTISPQVTVNARVTQRPTSNRGGAGVRQHGGPVAASSPYIVGEAGPELFVPRVSGHIVPHGPTAAALAGGGDTYQVNIAQPSREPDPVTYAMRQLRRYGETGLLPTRRKAAV